MHLAQPSCEQGNWSLHSRWNLSRLSLSLHVHGDKRWPTEVTSNTYFRWPAGVTSNTYFRGVPCQPRGTESKADAEIPSSHTGVVRMADWFLRHRDFLLAEAPISLCCICQCADRLRCNRRFTDTRGIRLPCIQWKDRVTFPVTSHYVQWRAVRRPLIKPFAVSNSVEFHYFIIYSHYSRS